jgi:phosphatidylinositol 4-phosphatase
MKNFFTKISKSPLAQKPAWSGLDFISGQVPAVPALQPKFTVPPVPHPCPYDHIAVLVTVQGLLLRPHVPGIEQSGDYVQVAWAGGREDAKGVVVRAAGVDGEERVADWTESAIVYGIVGILELFSSMSSL